MRNIHFTSLSFNYINLNRSLEVFVLSLNIFSENFDSLKLPTMDNKLWTFCFQLANNESVKVNIKCSSSYVINITSSDKQLA